MNKRIFYRPHRSGLNEALIESKIFDSEDEMLEYIVAQNALKIPIEDKPGAFEWIYPFKKGDLFLGEKRFYDPRINLSNCRYVKTHRYFNEFSDIGMVIGSCADYEHNLKTDIKYLIQKYTKKRG